MRCQSSVYFGYYLSANVRGSSSIVLVIRYVLNVRFFLYEKRLSNLATSLVWFIVV